MNHSRVVICLQERYLSSFVEWIVFTQIWLNFCSITQYQRNVILVSVFGNKMTGWEVIRIEERTEEQGYEGHFRQGIPIWRKYILSVQEASEYFHIGYKKLRKLIDENPDAEYILWNGTRPQIKRRVFERFVDEKLTAI